MTVTVTVARTTAKVFVKNVYINQEQKSQVERNSDIVLSTNVVLTKNRLVGVCPYFKP